MRGRCSLVLVLALLVGCTVASPPGMKGEPVGGSSEDEIRGTSSTAPAAAAELLPGRWRLIEEAVGLQAQVTVIQEHRRLSLGTDGRFELENYMTRGEGRWRFAEGVLTLGELGTAQLLSVDERQLVLIEDVPEVYLRGGPPLRVRNTYRRVSERELGPMLGETSIESVPVPGSYLAAYRFDMDKLPTMERTVSRHIDGAARLELREDGSVEGCMGLIEVSSSSVSRYESRDGQHHSSSDEHRRVVGFRGSWTATTQAMRVSATEVWFNACAGATGTGSPAKMGLECRALAANEVLPTTTLACLMDHPSVLPEELAINPADTERAGPYTLQDDPMGHISTDHGRPWLLLGAAPGIQVVSEDGRDLRTPKLGFTAHAVELVPGSYLPQPDPPAR